jgi:hypothetical protein
MTSWALQLTSLAKGQIQHLQIQQAHRLMTHAEVIECWQHSANFCHWYVQRLAASPYPAYFWEAPALTQQTLKAPYECILANSPQLAKISADASAFAPYFQEISPQTTVAQFPNLKGDAQLVVPCPLATGDAYPHLASFARQAPLEQQQQLFQTLAKTLQHQLGDCPLWVSTSGLGVYWLHLRIDTWPKYYTYAPFRTVSRDHLRSVGDHRP